jgi:hypothetical protein
MYYRVQIQEYLQAVAQQTYQNSRLCSAASQYFIDAYNLPSLNGQPSQLSAGARTGLKMFCLRYGYRIRVR